MISEKDIETIEKYEKNNPRINSPNFIIFILKDM